MAEQQVFEFRGVDNLYVAEVIQDDANAYACGTPFHLAPVAEIGKSTDSSSEAHYYDNKAMIVINSESADTITITMAPPELKYLAQIIGKSFDSETGMLVDSPKKNRYFALMYRTKGTDGAYRYVSRLKGQFTIPDETSATENDGTDTNNTQVTFTGIYTEHEFTKGIYNGAAWEKSGVKGIVVDTRYGMGNVDGFFNSVQTPDTIESGVTGITLSRSTVTVAEGYTASLNVVLSPSGIVVPDSEIAWTTSNSTVAQLVYQTGHSNTVAGASVGTATITATCAGYSATCDVTVEANE